MGEAVWLYMWLLDKMTTVNENGTGKVLGNKPIKFSDIQEELGISRQTYGRWSDKLRSANYINTLRTPTGLIITINKAKKGKLVKPKSDVPKTGITNKKKANSDVPQSDSDVPYSGIDVPYSGIQYKTKQGLNKTKQNTTNVVLAKAEVFGKPELNDLFKYWELKTGVPIASKRQPNRNACNNLFKRYGLAGMEKLIDGVALCQADKYGPRIADFCDLQAKLTQLLTWGKANQTNQKRTIKI